jgi:hypothetical protein
MNPSVGAIPAQAPPLRLPEQGKNRNMAKGMNKGNREKKKPKKDKSAEKPAQSSLTAGVRENMEKAAAQKK